MSSPHDNTVWQSPDGTWNIGMHDSEGYDFNASWFEWVSTGHGSPQEAMRAWDGANPGSHYVVAYDPNDPYSVERVTECEDIAAKKYESATKRVAEARARGTLGISTATALGYYGYHGPVKERTLRSLALERNEVEKANYSFPLNGHERPYDDRFNAIQARVVERLKVATDAEKRDYLTLQAERRDGLAQMLVDHRANQERQRRANAASIGMYRGYDAKAAQQRHQKRLLADAAVEAIEKRIARIDAKRAEQETEFFPPASAKTGTKKTASGAQGRVAKGVPAGGQFTASQRAESDVRL